MGLPVSLLKLMGRAVLNQVGAGVAGDLAFEVLPDMAHKVWEWWSGDKNEAERREELETLATGGAESIRGRVDEVVAALAADASPEVRRVLGDYLLQVPAMIRQTMRRPNDPTGRTVPADLTPRRAADMLALFPPRLPRFRTGDRPLRDSDWELDRLLGTGGFGEVWLARNPNMPGAEPVALKFCLDPEAARSLRNEAALLDRIMRQGRHPGIVHLRHTYLRAETPCLEYEYVAGGDLAGLIQDWHTRRAGPAPGEAARVAHRLAEIVAFAHRLTPPIVHRDLKPANVLTFLREDGSVGFKVADFGIGAVAAGAVEDGAPGPATATGVRGAFTPHYASPQQMRGERADPRDDVYALGVIWYQLLTGSLGEGAPTGLDWPDELAARGMSRPLIRLLASCIENRADRRPATAAELAERLAGELSAAPPPVPAPPPPVSVPSNDSVPPPLPHIPRAAPPRGSAPGRAIGRAERFNLHECTLPDGLPGVFKIAALPGDNHFLDREAFVLGLMAETARRLDDENRGGGPLNYGYFFPDLIDSHIAENQEGRRVNILGFPKEITSLGQLTPLSAVTEGGRVRVDPRTAAWIMGKILKLLAFAHGAGISNGQVAAGNILIERQHHGVIFFDWTHAAIHGDDSVPQDVARREIQQAALAVTLLLGGDPETGSLPPDDPLTDGRFESFLRRMASGGMADAARAHEAFYELIRALWPRRYHPFTTHQMEA